MNTSKTKIIELFDSEGEVKQYLKLSARIPEFLKQYGPDQGYFVTVESRDVLSMKEGMLRLYEAAISNGHNPEEVGLPEIGTARSVIFEAILRNKEGNVVASATALRDIRQHKDWEKGETAARQRLLAALGFGGETFDEDELGDINDQGLQLVEAKPEPVSNNEKSVKDTDGKPQENEKPQTNEDDKKDDDAVVPKTTTAKSTKVKPQKPQSQGVAGIPDSLVRQIQHQANMKGIEVPAYSTVAEAKKALKEVLAA